MMKQASTLSCDPSKIEILSSKEYGSSTAALSLARRVGFDFLISDKKYQWREDCLALIAGGLIYPASFSLLVNLYRDTHLWISCGHDEDKKPEINKNVNLPLEKLLERKESIEEALIERHGAKEAATLLVCYFPCDRNTLHFGLYLDQKGFPLALMDFSQTPLFLPENAFTFGYEAKWNIYLVDQSCLKEKMHPHLPNQKQESYHQAHLILDFFSKRIENGMFDQLSKDKRLATLFSAMLSYYLENTIERLLKEGLSQNHPFLKPFWAMEKLKSLQWQSILPQNGICFQKLTVPDEDHLQIFMALKLIS